MDPLLGSTNESKVLCNSASYIPSSIPEDGSLSSITRSFSICPSWIISKDLEIAYLVERISNGVSNYTASLIHMLGETYHCSALESLMIPPSAS